MLLEYGISNEVNWLSRHLIAFNLHFVLKWIATEESPQASGISSIDLYEATKTRNDNPASNLQCLLERNALRMVK